MVPVHKTTSERALQMNEASLKYLQRSSSFRADTKWHHKLSKGNNSKNIQSRVLVLMHDIISQCALQVFEVWLKFLKRFSSYRADTIFVTDRQMDGQTDRRKGETIYLPTLPRRDIMIAK